MSDKYAVPNKLPGKKVSILAHRRRRVQQSVATDHQKNKLRSKGLKRKRLRLNFQRPEAFISAFRKSERDNKRMKRLVLHNNLFNAENISEKLLVVMRHIGRTIHNPTTVKILEALRLNGVHTTVFLKNTKENRVLLKVVEPFVVYGNPNQGTVRNLVFKHGFAVIDGKSVSITSNTMIEEQLGHIGIICLEDIIHEILTVGSHFDEVTKFLKPFTLKNPKDGWTKKVGMSYDKGGECGDRKEAINELIARCE